MRFRRLSLLLASILLVSCGSGSPVDVQGLWIGGFHNSDATWADPPYRVYAAISEGGFGFALMTGHSDPSQSTGPNDVLLILPPISTSDVGGDVTAYEGPTPLVMPIFTAGHAAPDRITFEFGDDPADGHPGYDCTGVCGKVALTPYKPLTGKASLLPGPWQGDYLVSLRGSVPSAAITVTADGKFSGTDSDGCKFTGTIQQISPDEDLFTVSGTYLCGQTKATLNGLAFETDSDLRGTFAHAAGHYYYMGLSGTAAILNRDGTFDTANFAEFKAP
jgi:hypothetical protein